MIVTPDTWQATRDAVTDAGGRFADLIATTPDPAAPATLDWSVAETAAHVACVTAMYRAMLRPDAFPPPFPDLTERFFATTVDTLGELNELMLQRFTERDPGRLAELIRADLTDLLDASQQRDPTELLAWLGGAQLPVAGGLAHLSNELLLHGWDIARAAGTGWPIPPEQAAKFFELFLVGVTSHDYGKLQADGPPPPARRIAVEFRSRYTEPVTMVLDDGRVTVDSGAGTPDVRLRFEPVALNLMLFGRVSKGRTIFTGGVRVTGRRPWLLPGFLKAMRLPGRHPR